MNPRAFVAKCKLASAKGGPNGFFWLDSWDHPLANYAVRLRLLGEVAHAPPAQEWLAKVERELQRLLDEHRRGTADFICYGTTSSTSSE